jgi:hypothetical protein
MLRAIFFLDCDYCHDAHSRIDLRSDIDSRHTWSEFSAEFEESAFDDGWCHCLEEDTGKYLLMCGACLADRSFEIEQNAGS